MAVKLIHSTQKDSQFYKLDKSVLNSNIDVPGKKTRSSSGLFSKLTRYSKNVLKSTKDLAFDMADHYVPNAKELREELKNAKDSAVGDVKKGVAPIFSFVKSFVPTGGSGDGSPKGMIKATAGWAKKELNKQLDDAKKRFSTGEIYKSKNAIIEEQFASEFGDDFDFNESFNDDFSSDSDTYRTEQAPDVLSDEPFGGVSKGTVRKVNVSAEQRRKRASSKSRTRAPTVKMVQPQSVGVTAGDELGAKTTSNVGEAIITQQESLWARNITIAETHNKKILAYQDKLLKGLNAIVDFQNNVSSQGVRAQMEFQGKALAANEDMLNHMRELKDILVVLNDDANTKRENTLRQYANLKEDKKSKIIGGAANFNGSEYWKNVKENILNTSGGAALSMIPMLGDMLGGAGESGMTPNLTNLGVNFLANRLLSTSTKGKLGQFNEFLSNLAPMMIGRFNQMQKFGKTESARTIGRIFGQRDTRIRHADFGLKDPNAVVGWTSKSDRTLNEVIPTLLAKQLAALTGNDELVYDYRSGRFTNAKIIAKEAKAKIDSVFTDSRVSSLNTGISNKTEIQDNFESVMRATLEKSGVVGRKQEDVVAKSKGKFKEYLSEISKNLIKAGQPFSPELVSDINFKKIALGNKYNDPIADAALNALADAWTREDGLSADEKARYNAGITSAHMTAQKKMNDIDNEYMTYGGMNAIAEESVRSNIEELARSFKTDTKFSYAGKLKGTEGYLNTKRERLANIDQQNRLRAELGISLLDEDGNESGSTNFDDWTSSRRTIVEGINEDLRKLNLVRSGPGGLLGGMFGGGARDVVKSNNKLNRSINSGIDFLTKSTMLLTGGGYTDGSGILSNGNERINAKKEYIDMLIKETTEKVEHGGKVGSFTAKITLKRLEKLKEAYEDIATDENIPEAEKGKLLQSIENARNKVDYAIKTYTSGARSIKPDERMEASLLAVESTGGYKYRENGDEEFTVKAKASSSFNGKDVSKVSSWTMKDKHSLNVVIPGLLESILKKLGGSSSLGLSKDVMSYDKYAEKERRKEEKRLEAERKKQEREAKKSAKIAAKYNDEYQSKISSFDERIKASHKEAYDNLKNDISNSKLGQSVKSKAKYAKEKAKIYKMAIETSKVALDYYKMGMTSEEIVETLNLDAFPEAALLTDNAIKVINKKDATICKVAEQKAKMAKRDWWLPPKEEVDEFTAMAKPLMEAKVQKTKAIVKDKAKEAGVKTKSLLGTLKEDMLGSSLEYGKQAKKHKWNGIGGTIAKTGSAVEKGVGIGVSGYAGGAIGATLGSLLLGPLGGILGAGAGSFLTGKFAAKHSGAFNVLGKGLRIGAGIGGVGASALGGAKMGAALGSFLGPLGTLVGGVGGAAAGGLGSYMLGKGVLDLFKKKYPNLRASLVADGFVDAPKMKSEDLYAVVTNMPGARGEGLRGSTEYAKLQKEVYSKPVKRLFRKVGKKIGDIVEFTKYSPKNLKWRDVIQILNDSSEDGLKFYRAEPYLIYGKVMGLSNNEDKDKQAVAKAIMRTEGWKKLKQFADQGFIKKSIPRRMIDSLKDIKGSLMKWGRMRKYAPIMEALEANGFTSTDSIDDPGTLMFALQSLKKKHNDVYRVLTASKLYAKLEKDVKNRELKAAGVGFFNRRKELKNLKEQQKNKKKYALFIDILHTNGIHNFDDRSLEQIQMALSSYLKANEGNEFAQSIKHSKLYKKLCKDAGVEYDGKDARRSEYAAEGGTSRGILYALKKRFFKVAEDVGVSKENLNKSKGFVKDKFNFFKDKGKGLVKQAKSKKDELVGKIKKDNPDDTSLLNKSKGFVKDKFNFFKDKGKGLVKQAKSKKDELVGKIKKDNPDDTSLLNKSKDVLKAGLVKVGKAAGAVGGFIGKLFGPKESAESVAADKAFSMTVSGASKAKENMNGSMEKKARMALKINPLATITGLVAGMTKQLGKLNEGIGINDKGDLDPKNKGTLASSLNKLENKNSGGIGGLLGKIVPLLSAIGVALGAGALIKNIFNIKDRFKKEGTAEGIAHVVGLQNESDSKFNADGSEKSTVSQLVDRGIDRLKGAFIKGIGRSKGGKNAMVQLAKKGISKTTDLGLVGTLKKGIKKFLDNKVVKKMLGKAASKIKGFLDPLMEKIGKTAGAKLAKSGAGKVAKAIPMIGWALTIADAIKDFIAGAVQAPRYFKISSSECTAGMRLCASLTVGLRTLIEGILSASGAGIVISVAMALIPEDWLVQSMYKLIASDDAKAELAEKQNEFKERADSMGVSVERLNEAENTTFGQKITMGLKAAFSKKTYEDLKNEKADKLLKADANYTGSHESSSYMNDINVSAEPNKPGMEKLDDKVARWLTPSSDGNWLPVGDVVGAAQSAGYCWPHDAAKWHYVCTSPFGERTQPTTGNIVFHCGVDMRCRHDALYAFCSGTVVYAGFTSDDFGGTVVIRGDNGVIAVTAHHRNIKVKTGEQVKAGQFIGTSGGDPHDPGDKKGVGVNSNGDPASTGLHLHFSVIVGKTVVDPIGFVLNGCRFTDDIKAHELYGVLKLLLTNTCKIDFSGKQEEIMNGDVTTDVAPEASLADAAKEAGMSKTEMAKLGSQTSKGHDYTTKVNTNTNYTTSTNNNGNGSTAATAVKAVAKETPVSMANDTNSLLSRALDIQNNIYKEQVRHNAIVESFIKLMTTNINPSKSQTMVREIREKVDSISQSLINGADKNAVGL